MTLNIVNNLLASYDTMTPNKTPNIIYISHTNGLCIISVIVSVISYYIAVLTVDTNFIKGVRK